MVTLSAIEALGAAVVFGRIKCFEDFRLLAEWLECYQYVVPAERKLNGYLVAAMCNTEYDNPTAHELFKLWLRANILETNIPIKQQDRIASWLNQD